MTTTTLTAIRSALATTIVGLSCGGLPMGRGKYRVAADASSWKNRAEKDIDRSFTISWAKEGAPLVFGSTSEIDYSGELTITIGHLISVNREAGEGRMEADCAQIRSALEKKSNAPSGCPLVRFIGWTRQEKDKHWITELKFRTVHTRAAP